MFFGVDYASLSGFDAVAEEYSSGGAITAKRVFGPWPDELLGVLTATASYVHRDALGSVTRITDSAGSTSGSSRYFAFGSYREQIGSQDRYAFVSRESQLSGSLYYMRARYYDPTTGRFLSADPAGLSGAYNLYAYVGNNPVNFGDPSGLKGKRGGGGGGSCWPIMIYLNQWLVEPWVWLQYQVYYPCGPNVCYATLWMCSGFCYQFKDLGQQPAATCSYWYYKGAS
jgi:RHS repeat-associated protein